MNELMNECSASGWSPSKEVAVFGQWSRSLFIFLVQKVNEWMNEWMNCLCQGVIALLGSCCLGSVKQISLYIPGKKKKKNSISSSNPICDSASVILHLLLCILYLFLFMMILPFPLRSFFCLTMVENRKKHRQNSQLIILFPTSEGASEVSEQANEWVQRRARAKRAVRSKETSERCERMSERTSEWPSTSVCILGCFRP